MCKFVVQSAIYATHCVQWGAEGFLTGDFGMVVLFLSSASNLISLKFSGVFCFVEGGGVCMGVGFVVRVFFHCFTWGNFGNSVDVKYNLVVFLSSISRASRWCSIPF